MTGVLTYIANFDLWSLHALYALRTLNNSLFFIGVSELSATTTVIGVGLLGILISLYRKRIYDALLLATALSSAAAGIYVLKHLFARARPDEFFQAYPETGFSLPSGHATFSVALYFTLALLLTHTFTSRIQRISIFMIAATLALAIGFSRIFLGVHYVSDVLAGYVLGTFCVLIAQRICIFAQTNATVQRMIAQYL
jgi:membrane-associated phospholipid phosphatase